MLKIAISTYFSYFGTKIIRTIIELKDFIQNLGNNHTKERNENSYSFLTFVGKVENRTIIKAL